MTVSITGRTGNAGKTSAQASDVSALTPGATPTSAGISKYWTTEAIQKQTDRQELIAWAGQLDKQRNPLLPRQGEWTFFLTMTFRNSIPRHHAMSAGRNLLRWCSAWRTECPGGKGSKLFRLLLWSAEEHQTGAVHLHALSVTTPAVSPTHCRRCHEKVSSLSNVWRKLKESWFHHYGISRVYPYNPALRFGAERYVVKYVLAETCLDWGVQEW